MLAPLLSARARVPYEEQLRRKGQEFLKVLTDVDRAVADDVASRGKPPAEAPAPAAIAEVPVLPSPRTEAYRNKCEFTFGPGPDGAPTLGFLLGAFKSGVIAVVVWPIAARMESGVATSRPDSRGPPFASGCHRAESARVRQRARGGQGRCGLLARVRAAVRLGHLRPHPAHRPLAAGDGAHHGARRRCAQRARMELRARESQGLRDRSQSCGWWLCRAQ